MRTNRVEFLGITFDRLTFRQVKGRLRSVTPASPYGYIVTPNVDHVVRLQREPELAALYERAAVRLCDSRILRLLARLAGIKLPLVAGSDLSAAIFADVLHPGDTISVVGSSADFLERLGAHYPDLTILHHEPPMGLRRDAKARHKAASFVAAAQARFHFITVGSPQQEMIAREVADLGTASGVALCVGAGLEFLTGEQKRAPGWMQRLGLEWSHRLLSNPRRMWRRYLVDGPSIFPIFLGWMFRNRLARIVALAGALAILTAVALLVSKHWSVPSSWHGRSGEAGGPIAGEQALPLNLPPPNLLKPLSPEEAARENAERPFVDRPDTPPSKFVLKTDSDSRERALTCLAQAVYYEAAGEGVDGERAVAQVVLNRMHHPGYPASVCGVVYQGSDRPDGCQFTFTCDGSLLKAPAPALWTRARKIAADALAGKVFAPVGHATHYHADYVLPYWADSLDKTVQIGRHIFYRLRSSLGERNAFSQKYAGSEPEVKPAEEGVIIPPAEVTPELTTALTSDSVTGLARDVEKAGQPPASELAADLSSGTLIGDAEPKPAKAKKPKAQDPCATRAGPALSPLGPSDLRAGQADGC